MSELASAPPTKPRGPRRWPWVVVVVALLVLVGYVGGYGVLRDTRRISTSSFCSIDIGWPPPPPPYVIDRGNRLTLFFRPCIVVEEWWRNR